jgi:Cft2 family RNA processing exonuclease
MFYTSQTHSQYYILVSSLLSKRTTTKYKRKGFWKDRENRRQFLIDLAKSKGLDPFNPKTWTIITTYDIIAAKVSVYFFYIYSLQFIGRSYVAGNVISQTNCRCIS